MNASSISPLNNTRSCRICLDSDDPRDLISPCLCKGGSAYVHRKCLDNWRSINRSGQAFQRCDVCHFEYIIEPVPDDPSADQKRLWIFRLLVSRDISLILLLIQGIIVGMTFALQAADKNNRHIRDLFPTSMTSFGVYYLCSLILFLALLGFFGLIAACCGCLRDSDERHRMDNTGCACYSCYCIGCNNGCNGGGNCDGGGGEGAAVVVIVIVVIFALIGIVVGIVVGTMVIQKIMRRHTKKLWLRQEAKKYIVKDLQGQADRYVNRSPRIPTATPSIHQTGSSQSVPSAPMELLTLKVDSTKESYYA